MAITNVLVTSTNATIVFQAPLNEEHAITTMFFCNQSVTDAVLDLHIVPGPSPFSDNSQVMKSLPLPATETFVFDAEKLILQDGDRIYATVDIPSAVVATISSVKTS